MKLNYWGKFVEDSNPFAEHDVDDISKLIVVLVNNLNIFRGDICNWCKLNRWDKIKFIKALNEYLNYNVEDFDDFVVTDKLVDIGCGDIKLPVNTLKSLDENSKHKIVVVGKPGELHYLLKENMTLSQWLEKGAGTVSFSMKTGEELMFMKNYINDQDFIREMYLPGNRIAAEIYELRWILEYHDGGNKNVCASSTFDYPDCYSGRNMYEKIHVSEVGNGKYEIDIRDVDGRPVECEEREGESLYSVYYQYMIEKGHFKAQENEKKDIM